MCKTVKVNYSIKLLVTYLYYFLVHQGISGLLFFCNIIVFSENEIILSQIATTKLLQLLYLSKMATFVFVCHQLCHMDLLFINYLSVITREEMLTKS